MYFQHVFRDERGRTFPLEDGPRATEVAALNCLQEADAFWSQYAFTMEVLDDGSVRYHNFAELLLEWAREVEADGYTVDTYAIEAASLRYAPPTELAEAA